MNKKRIDKIIATIISILVAIILIGCFIYLTQIFLEDISIRSNIIILLISLMIISVPIIVSIKFLILMLKDKIKVSTNIISELILIPLSTIYLFVAILVICIIELMVPVRNYHQYKNLYNNDNELIRNFPNDIPRDAYDIEFYYEPPFLQKGKVMNLYFKVTDATINEYKEKYEKIEIDKNEIDIENLDKLYLDENIEINNNYRQYLLYSNCDDSGYCNHGSYSFVAINEISNECIFALYEW